jgi:ferredoxin
LSLQILSLGAAALMAIGLVVGIGLLSLTSGGLHFLFARPGYELLKSKKGSNGFAFAFRWNSSREPVTFDVVRLRMFNPFGTPTQVDVTRSFESAGSTFARDLDFGIGLDNMLKAKGFEDATIEIELNSSKEGISQYFKMKGKKFKEQRDGATETADQYNEVHSISYKKPLYHTTQRSFIAEPLPASNKALKIESNPEFAGDFAAAGGAATEEVENFSLAKVWIEPGCIVCDACETISPDVFEVKDGGCIVRPGAPLENGLNIQEAAEACPVEIIKFTKAS